jgi:hypothetical protein
MNFRRYVLPFISSSTLLLVDCFGVAHSTPVSSASITISPKITSLPVNGTQAFTATVTGLSAESVFWEITGWGLGVAGSFSGTGNGLGSGATVTYNAPATPPVYSETTGSGTTYQSSGGQGEITITATVGNEVVSANTSVTFPITGPMSVGILPATATVQLGKFVNFSGYCVGSPNNNLDWQVNGINGGNTAMGTITPEITGIAPYTAPVVMPMTGNTVTITAACQADPTKTASTTVTLTP